ncbi:ABC transporter substrate-binding protein [Lacticaseibacillus parakribbianus]|uniref:ABC transporter substrate-binding protein n=1 Tax=Lacticaseibacillus parakribbianus TaxID=2970927 RepID=UPI0021CB1AD6|nr:ABC transporter substrate-binding protein [Lacticaseibacillus parakribbianus]
MAAACGKSGSGSQAKTVVTMYRPGNKLKNNTEMTKLINKQIQKQYPNIELKIVPISWGDYQSKFNVMLTSGDPFDLAFAQQYQATVQTGAYADLTSLIKKYAKKAYDNVDPSYWQGISWNGKIYGFPTNANSFINQTVTLNGNFLKKDNISTKGVKSLQDVTPLLAKFHKANPSVTPFAVSKGYITIDPGYEFPLSNTLPFAIDQSGKSNKVINQYNTKQLQKNLKTMHEWYQAGYIAKDAATSTTVYNLPDDTWFLRTEAVGPYDYGNSALETAAMGKPITTINIAKPYKSSSDAQMAVYVVSKTSKHKKEAVQVLNAINTNKKLLNTMVWGIQGKQWQFTDKAKGKVKTLKGYQADTYYGAWMTGNNKLLYTKNTVTDAQVKQRDESIKNTAESAALGFMPDTTSVKTEMSNITNVMSKYNDILNTGTADPLPTIAKMNKELKAAGYDKVQKLLQKQYDKWLAEKK